MEWARALLEQQPLLTLALVIGLGYAGGEITVRGFSLGVGAVLFVGLLFGAIAPAAAPPGLLGTVGLVLFLYGIGIQYGREFFDGLTSAAGRKANAAALAGLAAGLAVMLAAIELAGVPMAQALGLFAGSMTSTAALQAALEATGSREAAVGYAVTYPFGVVGPILCLYLAQAVLKPTTPTPAGGVETLELDLGNPTLVGRPLRELQALLPAGVRVMAVRQDHRNRLPEADLVLGHDDGILLLGDDAAGMRAARELIGRDDPGRLLKDRGDLDYVRVFASRRAIVGRTLGDIALPSGAAFAVLHLRRGDTDLLPRPGLTLEFGDRIGLICHRQHFPEVRGHFGDSIKGTAEFSYVSVGLGVALGIVVGLLAVPVPGLGHVALGIAGGPLIVALVLGRLGRTYGLSWRMPASANLVVRNLGLTLFLASVGLASGAPFVATVQATGPWFLLIGAAILLAVVAVTLLLGHYLLRIPYDDLLGVTAGVTGNPAILACAARLAPTDRPDVGYAIIFPAATIVKIVLVELIAALYGPLATLPPVG